MPRIPPARSGQLLRIKHSEVRFSFWPVGRTERRLRLQSQLFVSDVWPLIAEVVERQCPKASREAAHAFRRQAEDYFKAASTGGVVAARPVLLYYSFLNLAKAFALTKGVSHLLGRAGHGISEAVTGRPISTAVVTLHSSTAARPQVFDEFLRSVSGKPLRRRTDVTFGNLLSQILPGHRLWCYAAGKKQRFFAVKRINYLDDETSHDLWVRLSVSREDLTRIDISHQQFMDDSGLDRHWKLVRDDDDNDPDNLWVEQKIAVHYAHRPGDVLLDVVNNIKSHFWQTVRSDPPYRRYYLFMAPSASRGDKLPQLLSMYAAVFFLGSITRYYPEHFERIVESAYGPHVEALLSETPTQFLYLYASELAEREVSKPAII